MEWASWEAVPEQGKESPQTTQLKSEEEISRFAVSGSLAAEKEYDFAFDCPLTLAEASAKIRCPKICQN